MPKIFISYRRADSRKDAGRIYDRLVDAFGKDNIFKDVDNIPFGRDFRGVLSEAVNQCQVMLAVIGQQWLTIADTDGSRRLDNPADFVRIEIQSGLQRGDDHCLVIPVIVDNAVMPNADKLPPELRELAFKNAITVRDDPDFHRDMERLVRQLQQYDIELKTREHVPVTQRSGANKTAHQFLSASDKSSASDNPASSPNQRLHFLKSPVGIVLAILLFLILLFLLSQIIPRGTNPPTPSTAALSASTTPPPTVSTTLTQTPVPIVLHNADWKTVEQDFDGVIMMRVPVGCFDMGSEQGNGDEMPVTPICFDQHYWIDKTEVTSAQFAQFSGKAAQSSNWTDSNRPRESVTWFEARDFCALRGSRLPTEAEWEYAARGPDNLIYPWGNDFDAANAVYSNSSNNQTATVSSKPSGFSWVGALDMSGNVWEWVSTLYKTYPYPTPNSILEQDSWIVINDITNNRVQRGGSWYDSDADLLRGAYRGGNVPDFHSNFVGFRCARSS